MTQKRKVERREYVQEFRRLPEDKQQSVLGMLRLLVCRYLSEPVPGDYVAERRRVVRPRRPQ